MGPGLGLGGMWGLGGVFLVGEDPTNPKNPINPTGPTAQPSAVLLVLGLTAPGVA